MRSALANVYALLFDIPPFEKRPAKCFFLNQYAVSGYDRHSVESYILYKSFMMACLIFVLSTILFVLPLFLQNTFLEGFYIFPDVHHNLPEKPVDYYKYGFPEMVSLPLIVITCIYTLLLSYAARDKHSWNFSSTRPLYLQNMGRLKKKWFGFTRIALLHLVFPPVLAIALYYMWAPLEFWNAYILLKNIHDFSAQTFQNFGIIVFIYLFFLPVCTSTFFVFIFLLLFEKCHSPTTTLQPLFRKRNPL